VAALLAACSSAPDYGSNTTVADVAGQRVDLDDSDTVKQILNQQYEDWHRVPHRMGGVSKSGIDCSGLVYTTYRNRLGVDVPRSTASQSKLGRSISREQLRAGDLVFFKTGVFTRHVGMYLDDGDFLHASSSNGVTISNLEDRYWTRTYWKARRIQ
jgi:cell wall-associated NlpC family hydrolase